MKKLVLVFVSIILLSSCSSKEGTQARGEFPPCTINGHACLEIIRLLDYTKVITPTQEEVRKYAEKEGKKEVEVRGQLFRFDNPKLQQMGIEVVDSYVDKDFVENQGGTITYVLSNGTTILLKINEVNSLEDFVDFVHTTVSFPNSEVYIFNGFGEIIEHHKKTNFLRIFRH